MHFVNLNTETVISFLLLLNCVLLYASNRTHKHQHSKSSFGWTVQIKSQSGVDCGGKGYVNTSSSVNPYEEKPFEVNSFVHKHIVRLRVLYSTSLFTHNTIVYEITCAHVQNWSRVLYYYFVAIFLLLLQSLLIFFPCSLPVGRKHFSPATDFTYSRYATNAARSIRAAAQRSFIMIFSPPFDANAFAGKHRLTYQTDVFLSCRLDLLPWPQT